MHPRGEGTSSYVLSRKHVTITLMQPDEARLSPGNTVATSANNALFGRQWFSSPNICEQELLVIAEGRNDCGHSVGLGGACR